MSDKHEKIAELITQGQNLLGLLGRLSATATLKFEVKFVRATLVSPKEEETKGFNVSHRHHVAERLMKEIINEALIDFTNNGARIKALFKQADIVVVLLLQAVIGELDEVNKKLVELKAPPFEFIGGESHNDK